MDSVAFLAPTAVGRKFTTKVVELPPDKEALGAVVMVNSDEFVPEKLIAPMVKAVVPVLLIV